MLSKRTARIAGVVGAFVGAAIGYWGVGVLAKQGFHAIVLPAGLPGIVAGVISRERSVAWGVVYAIIGVAAALFTEWRYRPFIADGSFDYFVRHIGDLKPMVLVIIVVGAIIGGMFSLSVARRRAEKTPDEKRA
jgi:hypothetical protein